VQGIFLGGVKRGRSIRLRTSLPYVSRFSIKYESFDVSHSYGSPKSVIRRALIYVQGIHKRIVRFQMLPNNSFLILYSHNIHCQQRELSRVLMCYRQFAAQAYCWAAGPVFKMASQQRRLSVCSVLRCPDLWLQCSVSFVQGLKRTPHKINVIFKPCTQMTLHCNNRFGHLKTKHTESLLLLWRQLGNWSHGPAVSMRCKLLISREKFGQFPLMTVTLYPCRGRNKFSIILKSHHSFVYAPQT
jgi:hypothetical protein